MLVTLFELVWAGIPDAPVFVLAISARALRIADVSAVGAPLTLPVGFAACSEPAVKEMKSFGGLPGGVVDFTPTEERSVSEITIRRCCPLFGYVLILLFWEVLPFGGASSFSLKFDSISFGKVLPRSQISTSFLILAYYMKHT